MKKKIIALLLAGLLAASVAACSGSETDSSTPQSSTPQSSTHQSSSSAAAESEVPGSSAAAESEVPGSSEASEASTPAPTEAPTPEPVEQDGFEVFAAGLADLGGTWEGTQMAADMIGAEKGVKYTSEIGSVELYQFAEGAEALSTGTVTLEGFGEMPIEVAGVYGLFVSVDSSEQEILDLFQTLA